MGLYRLSEPADQLVAPAIVAAFDGWIDAAGASTAATVLVGGDGEAVASFDPDALYDYRSRRPVLDVLDGKLTELVWPDLTLKRARHGARDLLVLTGPEPDFKWRELSQDVLGDFFHPFHAGAEWLHWNDGTLRNMAARIADVGDLWSDMLECKQSLRGTLEQLRAG